MYISLLAAFEEYVRFKMFTFGIVTASALCQMLPVMSFVWFQHEIFAHTCTVLVGQCENSLTRIRRLFVTPGASARQGVGEYVFHDSVEFDH